MKRKAFFFHYNKPASNSKGKVQVSLHYDKKCYVLDNIKCNVPTVGRIKKTQPRWVMSGKATSIEVIDNIGVIN